MNILMVASEATPFAKTGGLADVLGALPAALQSCGEHTAVVIPAYRQNQYPERPQIAYRSLWVPIGPGYLVDIYRTTERGVTFYFVDCPPLFDRDGIYC
jgi:starch synthase